eukprot:CAMPEP_0113968454 /NCGR_PEP_ID=MMETSP0011_2-20120614/9547_1 /TAXON_ID=101924 /ORGANISM="Rhodosorus marinus" /LENGTH=36 /DNA_ID=CAMNT_0000981555 /DNA_START=221 /DNA_END=331 /DNA_ORIENTATION=+ /assembly_acc=CAM_ASM_000156
MATNTTKPARSNTVQKTNARAYEVLASVPKRWEIED